MSKRHVLCDVLQPHVRDFDFRATPDDFVCAVWVELKTASQKTTNASGQLNTITTTMGRCKYTPKIKPGMKLKAVHHNQMFSIETVVDVNDRSVFLDMSLVDA